MTAFPEAPDDDPASASDRFDERDVRTLELALETWGKSAQFDMATEESAELILSVARVMRGREGDADLVDEVADVKIITEQLSLMLGEERVNATIDVKMDRLRSRLDEAGTEVPE